MKKQGNKLVPILIKQQNTNKVNFTNMKKTQKTSEIRSISTFAAKISQNEILSLQEMKYIRGGDGDVPPVIPPAINK